MKWIGTRTYVVQIVERSFFLRPQSWLLSWNDDFGRKAARRVFEKGQIRFLTQEKRRPKNRQAFKYWTKAPKESEPFISETSIMKCIRPKLIGHRAKDL